MAALDWIIVALVVFGIPSALVWIMLRLERTGARRCQYCCNMISKWGAFFGVLNCGSCVSFMSSGRAPRCRVQGCMIKHPNQP